MQINRDGASERGARSKSRTERTQVTHAHAFPSMRLYCTRPDGWIDREMEASAAAPSSLPPSIPPHVTSDSQSVGFGDAAAAKSPGGMMRTRPQRSGRNNVFLLPPSLHFLLVLAGHSRVRCLRLTVRLSVGWNDGTESQFRGLAGRADFKCHSCIHVCKATFHSPSPPSLSINSSARRWQAILRPRSHQIASTSSFTVTLRGKEGEG